MFRTNFVLFWLIANIVYYIMILQFINGETQDGQVGYLEVFSMMLATLVVFRVLFAAIYIIGWKCRYCCFKNYTIKEQNLDKNFKKLKENADREGGADSTDDEEILQECNKIFKTHEKKIFTSKGGAESSKGSRTGSIIESTR